MNFIFFKYCFLMGLVMSLSLQAEAINFGPLSDWPEINDKQLPEQLREKTSCQRTLNSVVKGLPLFDEQSLNLLLPWVDADGLHKWFDPVKRKLNFKARWANHLKMEDYQELLQQLENYAVRLNHIIGSSGSLCFLDRLRVVFYHLSYLVEIWPLLPPIDERKIVENFMVSQLQWLQQVEVLEIISDILKFSTETPVHNRRQYFLFFGKRIFKVFYHMYGDTYKALFKQVAIQVDSRSVLAETAILIYKIYSRSDYFKYRTSLSHQIIKKGESWGERKEGTSAVHYLVEEVLQPILYDKRWTECETCWGKTSKKNNSGLDTIDMPYFPAFFHTIDKSLFGRISVAKKSYVFPNFGFKKNEKTNAQTIEIILDFNREELVENPNFFSQLDQIQNMDEYLRNFQANRKDVPDFNSLRKMMGIMSSSFLKEKAMSDPKNLTKQLDLKVQNDHLERTSQWISEIKKLTESWSQLSEKIFSEKKLREKGSNNHLNLGYLNELQKEISQFFILFKQVKGLNYTEVKDTYHWAMDTGNGVIHRLNYVNRSWKDKVAAVNINELLERIEKLEIIFKNYLEIQKMWEGSVESIVELNQLLEDSTFHYPISTSIGESMKRKIQKEIENIKAIIRSLKIIQVAVQTWEEDSLTEALPIELGKELEKIRAEMWKLSL